MVLFCTNWTPTALFTPSLHLSFFGKYCKKKNIISWSCNQGIIILILISAITLNVTCWQHILGERWRSGLQVEGIAPSAARAVKMEFRGSETAVWRRARGQRSNPVWSWRNEKVLITTLMPACQSPAGLSRQRGGATLAIGARKGGNPSDQSSWGGRTDATDQTRRSIMKVISHSGWEEFVGKNKKEEEKKPYLSGYRLRGKSQVTAGGQSWLFRPVWEHKSGLMYITNPTTLHNPNLFF